MKTIQIQAIARTDIGTQKARRLRDEGYVPGIIYGVQEGKKLPLHFSLPIDQMRKIVKEGIAFIEIEVGKERYTTILQEKQTHPVSDEYTHIDLLAIRAGQVIKMNIPVVLKGKSIGVNKGGLAVQKMRTLKVQAAMEQMPAKIEVDITPLDLGKTLRVRDIPAEGYTFLAQPSIPVVMVEIPRSMRSSKSKATAEQPQE